MPISIGQRREQVMKGTICDREGGEYILGPTKSVSGADENCRFRGRVVVYQNITAREC